MCESVNRQSLRPHPALQFYDWRKGKHLKHCSLEAANVSPRFICLCGGQTLRGDHEWGWPRGEEDQKDLGCQASELPGPWFPRVRQAPLYKEASVGQGSGDNPKGRWRPRGCFQAMRRKGCSRQEWKEKESTLVGVLFCLYCYFFKLERIILKLLWKEFLNRVCMLDTTSTLNSPSLLLYFTFPQYLSHTLQETLA